MNTIAFTVVALLCLFSIGEALNEAKFRAWLNIATTGDKAGTLDKGEFLKATKQLGVRDTDLAAEWFEIFTRKNNGDPITVDFVIRDSKATPNALSSYFP